MPKNITIIAFLISAIGVLLVMYLYFYDSNQKSNRFDFKIDNSNSLLIGQAHKSTFHVVCLLNEPYLLLRTRFPEEYDPRNVPVFGSYDTALYISAHDRGRLMGGAIHGATINGHKAKVYFDLESYHHRELIVADASGSEIRRVLSNITETGYFWIGRDEMAVELSGRLDGRQINPFIERCQGRR